MDYGFLHNILTGADHVNNPIGHLAIIASIEVDRPQAGKLQPKSIEKEKPKGFNLACIEVLEKNHIAPKKVLNIIEKQASEHGLSADLGLMLIQGASENAVSRELGISRTRCARFWTALDRVNFHIEAAIRPQSRGLALTVLTSEQIASDVRATILRNKHRETLSHIAKTVSPIRRDLQRLAATAYEWCLANDRVWFEEMIASADKVEKRRRHRGTILALIDRGCDSQTAVRRYNFEAYRWCVTYDRLWLDETIPSIQRSKRLSFEAMREECRVAVTDAVKRGARTRRQIPGFAWRFLTKFDSAWLNETLPKAVCRPAYCKTSFDQFRNECREVIVNAITAGATTRKELPGYAMRFCRDYDSSWLHSKLPGRRPVNE
jgi:hypothetical protein